MTAPYNSVAVDGQNSVSADQLNTYLQNANYASNLANFIGAPGMVANILGLTTVNDGGQGFFYWNATGTANDGTNNIAPFGAPVGCWTRILASAILGTLTVSGNGTIGGTLGVTGALTAGSLSVGGNSALTGNLAVSGIISGTLAGQYCGSVNKFRNPEMAVAQYGTSGTVAANTNAISVDGWYVGAGTSSVNWTQGGLIPLQNLNGLSANSLILTAAGSGSLQTGITQNIEGAVAAPLSGEIVTLQITIANQTSNTITPGFRTGYANSQDNFSSVTYDVQGSFSSIAPGVTATVAYTFYASIHAVQGYEVAFFLGSALSQTGNTVVFGAADIRATPGLPVGINTTPPVPERRPIGLEQALNERYYTLDSAAAFQGSFSGSSHMGWVIGWVPFKQTMRAQPTITLATNVTTGVTFSGLSVQNVGVHGFQLTVNTSGTGDWQYEFSYTASSVL